VIGIIKIDNIIKPYYPIEFKVNNSVVKNPIILAIKLNMVNVVTSCAGK